MKCYIIISFFCIFLFLTSTAEDNFDIVLKPKWRNLDNNNNKKDIDFGGKWILVGSITFKKKSKEPLFIDTISLRWNGEPITNLIASLYKKNFSKDFLPIEDNLICDGLWNNTKQTIIFNFEEKETLTPRTTFYLVLTIPEIIEDILTKGSFSLEEQSLPKPFKQQLQSMNLSLTINAQTMAFPAA